MKILSLMMNAFVVLVLTIVPFPSFFQYVLPNWVVLYFMFLTFSDSKIHAYLLVWLLGLFLDIMQQNILGLHVAALLSMQLFLNQYRLSFMMFPLSQQMLIVILGTFIYLMILLGFEVHRMRWGTCFQIVQSSMVTALFWLCLDVWLKRKNIYKKKLI